MKILEQQVKTDILQFLKMNGIKCWPNDSVGIYDPKKRIHRKNRSQYYLKGTSDILGILPDGRFLAIEVKKPYIKGIQSKGTVSMEQKQFVQEINNRGGVAFVAYSIDCCVMNMRDYLKNIEY